MFCLVDQDCDSKWTKIKTSLRSRQHTSSRLHLARWGQGSGHSGEDSHWRQIFLNISINYIWSAGNRNDTREKIEAIYLLFLRILVSSDAYDGMGDISSRHLSVSRQTLPDIANPGTELSHWSVVSATLLPCHARYCLIWHRRHQQFGGIFFLQFRLLFPYQHNWFTL